MHKWQLNTKCMLVQTSVVRSEWVRLGFSTDPLIYLIGFIQTVRIDFDRNMYNRI